MRKIRTVLATVAAAAVFTATPLLIMATAPAQAVSTTYLRPALAAAHSLHLTCQSGHGSYWRVSHRMDRNTIWSYVPPAVARMYRIGYCSKMIEGPLQTVIISQAGSYVDGSYLHHPRPSPGMSHLTSTITKEG
jgi:hypothetical protein